MAFAWIARLLKSAGTRPGPIVAPRRRRPLDERRLDGLVRVGVNEIAAARHHRYVTPVVALAARRGWLEQPERLAAGAAN